MIKDLLTSLSARGIRLELVGTNIRIVAPSLTQQDRNLLADELRPRKKELIEFLSLPEFASLPGSMSTISDGYEVAPGVCIHPPKTSEEFLRWREKWKSTQKR